MNNRRSPELDMTLTGEFVDPPRQPKLGSIMPRLIFWAIVIAIIAGALAIAALALWLAMLLLPVVLIAGVVAYALHRFQSWRMHHSISSHRNLWRS